MKAIYRGMCPNCGDRISDERLREKNPCERCLDEPVSSKNYFDLVKAVRDALQLRGELKEWEEIHRLESQTRGIEAFFESATGFRFWSAQRTWVKRLLRGTSFSIIAPTGMGKSTFGAFMAVWHAKNGRKSYIVVPTTPLVIQTVKKVMAIAERAGVDLRLAYYHGNLRKKEKEEMLDRIRREEYDILITSAQWMARKFEDELKGRHFDFVFVDDVDAFLKASKNIDRSLYLLGFNEEMIGKAWEIIRLKKNMARYLNGRAEDREERLKEINEGIRALQKEIEEFKYKNDIGIMIIASATGSARGDRIKLYRELLGFEVGSGRSALRNVVDSYLKPQKDVKDHVEELLRKLGKGGIVFTPIDQGLGYAEELVNYLREKGLKVELVSSKNKRSIEKFENGEADYLVGSATYYGSLVRGLDLPHLIRYSVFTGVPKFRFSINLERPTIYRALGLMSEVMDFLGDEDRKTAEKFHARLRRLIRNIPQFELLKIEEALAEGLPIENEFHNHVLGVFRELVEFLRKVLKDKEVLKKLAEDPFVSLREEEGKWYIEIPDVRTYIQATGRTSRLFAGGITKGLSVLIVDNEKVFNGLVRQMRWRFTEFKMASFEELNLDEILKQIDEDREKVRLVMEGKISARVKDLVKSSLMIVESPNKARTIASFFGQPSKRRIGDLVAYEVSIGNRMLTILASGGHMFDLVTNDGYHGVLIENKSDDIRFIPLYDTIKRCRDCGHQFIDWEKKGTCPRCGSTNVHDALQNVKAMREIAQEVDEILIATDPDTEGEKIAWDIRNVLSPYTPNIKRIEFHEVTRPAILRALEEARDVNEGRVNAQIVRRVEDRWIGFELSQELQRVFENYNLSAGRVQTPVLGWIIERYREFTESETYFLGLELDNGLRITVELGKDGKKVEPPEEVTVESVRLEERDITPAPPYTTDTMLKDASTFLKLSAHETMRLAQDLFEAGLTTYHRTDSTHVSNTGIEIAKEYITQGIGEEYFKPRPWGEEGAHECIRPTRPIDTGRLMQLIRDNIVQLPKNLTRNHYRLYDMIFRKFMASQMPAAKILHEKATINTGVGKVEIEGYTELLNSGWSRIRKLPLRELPKLEAGQRFKVVESKRWKAPKVQLYSQGDIIAMMKNRKIGRPSTYAKIVKTLLQRYYVIETRGRKKLLPTEQGMKVYHYLMQKYRDLVNEEKTRELEELMDLIEEEQEDYQKVLQRLYSELKEYTNSNM
ncbi:reverse gyrase [Thermococcus sp.]|uniref:reverse gyrase n=1 Tax=Thermococcus sp. TaxID=35749 RepID=UPI002620C460|nr:reverse gyrase [Thermococcus sp.]